ncbi:RES family NAD+ phosphorylase [Actinoplanes sp. NPDC049681]|uniref:RES family NAD+ phosphorylase n=1 Tax=Actinoplanes sp. NPDC049681 TaxID=3363905 RepID=UPI00378C844E
MSLPPPPASPPGDPVIDILHEGTRLFRVHQDRYAADAFNPKKQPSILDGGRFDSLDGSYAYTYLGDTAAAAIAETICRDVPINGSPRLVPRSRISGRSLTAVDITRDVSVLVLHGAALNQVGAPLDLTKCEADQYVMTRRWAQALRMWCPGVAGFRYRPRHDEDRLAFVLFDDTPGCNGCRARGAIRAASGSSLDLTSTAGRKLLDDVLREHNAALS